MRFAQYKLHYYYLLLLIYLQRVNGFILGGNRGRHSGVIVLKSCLRNDVPSFQLNDFLMNSALLLGFQKALSQVKMELRGTH